MGFLTVVGGAAEPGPATLVWFPVVGAGIGAAVGGTWALGSGRWPTLLTAVLAVGVDLLLTGLLHIDGLADSGDGLIAPMSRARRLEVMALPDVGAFGVAVVAWFLLVRVGALSSGHLSFLLITGLWAMSRTIMATAILIQPYARGDAGLAAAFRPARQQRARRVGVPAGGAALAVALMVVGSGLVGLLAAVVAVVMGGAVLVLAQRRLGGFTGDVLGAAGIVAESAGLVAAALR